MIIGNESALSDFRAGTLSPANILTTLTQATTVLVSAAQGAGKTTVLIDLILAEATWQQFDGVVLFVPRWNVIDEIVGKLTGSGAMEAEDLFVLRARPKADCGHRDDSWQRYQELGLSLLPAQSLCTPCQSERKDGGLSPCIYPDRFTRMAGVKVVITADAQLSIDPNVANRIAKAMGAKKPLVILDEAEILLHPQMQSVGLSELSAFGEQVRGLDLSELIKGRVADGIKRLEALGPGVHKLVDNWSISPGVRFSLQSAGFSALGASFRDQSGTLQQVHRAQTVEVTKEGIIRWRERFRLPGHQLVLRPNTTVSFVSERLSNDDVIDLTFETQIQHRDTRVVQLDDSIGAMRFWKGNQDRLLDFYAAKVLDNIIRDRTTLLICRKRTKDDVIVGINKQLKLLCCEARAMDAEEWQGDPDPYVIPVIHYGMMGINDFEAFNSAYCVNAYNIRDKLLIDAVMQDEIQRYHSPPKLKPGAQRRFQIRDARDAQTGLVRNIHDWYRELELQPILQAVGRVRPWTKPRELILIGTQSFDGLIPKVEQVRSLDALYRTFNIERPKVQKRLLQLTIIQNYLEQGLSLRQIAAETGISKSTIQRRVSQKA